MKDTLTFVAHGKNVLDGCKELADESIDLAIWSPPYKLPDGYTDELMRSAGATLARVLKPGGNSYMIFGQLRDNFARPMTARSAVIAGSGKKLKSSQTIIWAKSVAIGGWEETCAECSHSWKAPITQRGHYQPINSPDVLNYGFEYIFGFSKAPSRKLDRKSIGVPYTDKSNVGRFQGAAEDLHCPGDVWFIPYETVQKKGEKTHRHQFPLELPRRLIVMNDLAKGSLVLDLFMGSGTTAVASRLCGMNAVGYDRDVLMLEKAKQAWKEREGERWALKGAR